MHYVYTNTLPTYRLSSTIRRLLPLFLLALPTVLNAQQKLLNLKAEARVDYQRMSVDGETDKSSTGFKGKYVNLIAMGDINDKFSYVYRQRLIKPNKDASYFDSIDFLYLTWRANEQWSFSAGKQIVGIGGFEYDRAPINLYFSSEYWNNIECYEMGVSAEYKFKSGRDRIVAQVSQSPNRANAGDMYAYNVAWYGQHGAFSTIYSLNLLEYMPHRYISYITLGHKIEVDKVKLEVDFMNRAASHQTFFFKDCSVMAEVGYRPIDKLNLFGKAVYDVNQTERLADYCVMPGTEITNVGAGAEYFPIRDSQDVRLHLVYSHAFGKNGNPNAVTLPDQDYLSLGLTWRVDLLSLTNKK